ncbi:hypothetical protein Tco_0699108 [Tanacetum coccineum]
MPPRCRQPQPAGAPTNAYVDPREEVNELRRQVKILSERLTQLEPPYKEEEFELNDTFENPFHRHARYHEQPMHRRWEASIKNLRQGIKSVEEYTEEFYELVSCNEISDSEDQLISREQGHRSSTCRKERGKQLMMENEKSKTYDYEDEVEYNVEPRYDEDEEYNEDNFISGDVG